MPNLSLGIPNLGLIILVVVAVLLVIWAISVQKKLVSADEIAMNAMSQIGVQQSSRWDALTQIARLAKEYSEFEYKSLVDIISKRQPVQGDSTAAQAQNQENMITQALSRIVAIAEQYPELKTNQLYSQTMSDVNRYEDNVRKSRMVYNDAVTKYNRYIRQIPDSFVAGIFGFKSREYLDTDTAKTEMPNLT